jgi:hypothetical protein
MGFGLVGGVEENEKKLGVGRDTIKKGTGVAATPGAFFLT